MKSNHIIKQKFNLEVTVDKREVVNKYPNYKFNFDSVDDFINFIINDLRSGIGINYETESFEKFGYSVKITPEETNQTKK